MPELPQLDPELEDQLVEVLERARSLGLVGPGPVEAHIDQAAHFVAALDDAPPLTGLDLGSGAGLPGLFLALYWPASTWILLDAMERRCTFLREAIETLGLGDRVDIGHGRAEELAHDDDLRASFDVVTARSFGAPGVTAECAVGFIKVGGRLAVSEPPQPGDRWPSAGLAELNLTRRPSSDASIFLAELSGELPDRLPRRTGIPEKRPLF